MANEIPIRFVRWTLQLFQRPRAELEQLLVELDLPLDLLDEKPEQRLLDADSFGRLFMALVKRSQQEIQGDSEVAEQVQSLSAYRLMFSYMLQARNLDDALSRAAMYFLRFHAKGQGFSLESEGDFVRWRFNFDPVDDDEITSQAKLGHFSMGNLNWLPGLSGRVSALYAWHRTASWFIGNFIDLEAINIDCPLVGDASDFSRPFRAPVYFNQDDCSLRFHVRYLEFQIVRNEADLNRMLESFPAELMRADEMADSTAARVRGLFGNDYSQEMPSLEQVAERLLTTPPTLHRRLSNEGTSFQQIKDACRRDAAIELLRVGESSGSKIAELLGFSDASTFYRAFKRWTGITPQEFRRRET